MSRIRVVIADDDVGIRSALEDVLDADPRFSVVGSVATGQELRTVARAVAPHVVLLDIRMPGGGPEAARALLEDGLPDGRRPLVVIAVSAHTAVTNVVSMLRAGAVGYLAKGRLAALPDLVARCAEGEVVLAVPGAAEALRQLTRDDLAAARPALR